MARKIRITYYSRFIAIIFSFWSAVCYAQSPRLPFSFIEQVKIGDGIFDNAVNCLLEDKNGYLWLGTNAGLKRYDIGETHTFRHDKNDSTSLVNNVVKTLCEDKKGRIWVGTIEGVCCFDKTKNRFFSIKELNQLDFACLNIICDSAGNIWFSIRDKGLYCFNTETNQLKNYAHNKADIRTITSNRVLFNGLVEDTTAKGLWIATDNGLNLFDFTTQTFNNQSYNPLKIPILKPSISALTIHQKQLVFSDNSQKQIVFYDSQKKIVIKTISPTLTSKNDIFDIYQIFFDNQQNIWLSGYNRIAAVIKAKSNEIIEIKYEPNDINSFSDNNFTDAFQQKNGMLWFSTRVGLTVIDPNNNLFDFYNFSQEKTPLNSSYFRYFAEDSNDESWWIADNTNNLLHFNPKTNSLQRFKVPQKPNSYIVTILDYKNSIIIACVDGIYIFDKNTKHFAKLELPKIIKENNKVAISHILLQGDVLWLFGKGVDFYDTFAYSIPSKKWQKYPILTNSKNPRMGVNFSLLSRSNDIWLAIHGVGLAKFSSQKKAFEIIKTKQKINFDKVGFTNFCEDSKGNLWISSYDLIKFNPKTNDFLSVVDTDLSGWVEVDKYDNVWLNTIGDFMVNYADKKLRLNLSVSISDVELHTDWYNHLARLKNGKIISFLKERLVLIDPEFLKQPSTNDNILISQVNNADTTILLHENDSKINFKADENTFAIYYGIVSPPSVSKYGFFYKLEGYDKDWIEGDGRYIAIYGKLPGGDYVFKVKAIDVNGKVLPTQALNIHIDTKLYNNFWFRVLFVLTDILIIFAFFRYRANQRSKIYHLQMQSTRLEKDKTEIQYQNLINHLNPHFLFNSLTSLNGLILTEPDTASSFLQKLSKIYRYILQNKDKELVSLEQELAFVKNYVDLQKSRFEEGLQININIDDEYLTSEIVPVTLQNLFENAIKHNTIEEYKPLIINVFTKKDYLIIKNNLQKKKFVETSNKQGLDSLKSLYKYLTSTPLETIETANEFIVKIPLL